MTLYVRRWNEGVISSPFFRAVLWVAERCRRPMQWLGIEPRVFTTILRAKFIAEMRSSPFGTPAAIGGVALTATLMLIALIGAAVGTLALTAQSPFRWMLIAQTAGMGLQGMMLITQYGNLFVDATDMRVLAPHPVTDRTLFAARLAHATLYVSVLALAFHAGAFVLALFAFPPAAVLATYPLLALASTLLCLGGMACAYTLALRLVGPVRYQRVAFWLQIGLAGTWFAGLQVLPGSLPLHDVLEWASTRPWVALLYPPLSYARIFESAMHGDWQASRGDLWVTLALPALAVLVAGALASRHFVAGLSGELSSMGARTAGWQAFPRLRASRLLTRSELERAGFEFALANSRRDPQFLRAVWPQLIGYGAMGLAMVWNARNHTGLPAEVAIPFVISLSMFALPSVLEAAQHGQDPAARWMLLSAPLERPRALHTGAIKALLFTTVVPLSLGVALGVAWMLGAGAVPRIVLALEMVAAMGLYFVRRLHLYLPFTRHPRLGEVNYRNCGTLLGLLMVQLVLGGAHLLLCLHPVTLWGAIVLFLPPVVFLYVRLGRIEMPALEPL